MESLENLQQHTERVAKVTEQLTQLSPQEVASIWLMTGMLLSEYNVEATAKLFATPILMASFGTEEEQELNKNLGTALALAIDAIVRETHARKWVDDMLPSTKETVTA